jgi:hypothetical protein
VRKPWAAFSGRTNYRGDIFKLNKIVSLRNTYLIELVAEVYWVDVVALKIGEHDDLGVL